MKHDIKIVIGANFGDEGKGLMADYFAHEAISQGKNCVVCLYNGGAQRGHTVETSEGIRHVFHHFGSGTLAGAATYFSPDFLLNPMTFHTEWNELADIKIRPIVYASPACRITTPFDMILNQLKEISRGSHKHGSCGMGIWETIRRNRCGFSFDLRQACSMSDQKIRDMLYRIRDVYFIDRIQAYNIDIPLSWRNIIWNEQLISNYIDDVRFMQSAISTHYNVYESIIFEGGQGLLLSQDNIDYAPHLTPSYTGARDPMRIIEETFDVSDVNIEACYVSRTYITRHGAGRLDHECSKNDLNPSIEDFTNIFNPHQDSLRYAPLYPRELKQRIALDCITSGVLDRDCKVSVAFTHTNEMKPPAAYVDGFDCIYASDNKTRNSVKRL